MSQRPHANVYSYGFNSTCCALTVIANNYRGYHPEWFRSFASGHLVEALNYALTPGHDIEIVHHTDELNF